MQTGINRFSKQTGSVLVVALVLAIILGTTLASYLYWVRTQNMLVAESQAWNSALNLAEAGIEEGMAQINVNVGTTDPTNYSQSIATNFSLVGSVRSKTGALGYTVIVSNDFPPTIYSSATSTVPLLGNTITRTVKVQTINNAFFGTGITALQNIDMKGDNIYVDAFDSADLVHFTNGWYNPTYAIAKGDVATTGGIVNVGNADIHGRLILAPGGTYNIGPQGLVGDMPANWAAQSGLQSDDWLIQDFNKQFTGLLPAPFSGGMDPTTTGNSTNQYDLTGGNWYFNGNLPIDNNKILYARSGVVNLYVTGNLSGTPNSTVQIAPGATLKLYVGTASGSAVGLSFGAVNNAGNAANFQVYGLPTCTSFNLAGNGSYIGTIYGPECVFTVSGGGVNTLDYQGACVVYSVSMNGHFNLHYDINLARNGPPSGYTLSSWQEL